MAKKIINLADKDVKKLIDCKKFYEGNCAFDFPLSGHRINIELFSYIPKRIAFFLDISRQSFNIKKITYQQRVFTTIVLLRLDLGYGGHRNPDGIEIHGAHIHVYREGYGDKWAYKLPECFSDTEDIYLTLDNFMDYCNIEKKPIINKIIF